MTDQDDLVTIATFSSTVDAELAKSRLESEGINVALGNELASGLMPYLGSGLGGVTLQVANHDVERAKEVLGPVT
jgi:hypothetical protein